MRVIVYPSFEEEFNKLDNYIETCIVYGRVFENFSVVHMTGFSQSVNTYPIGLFTRYEDLSKKPMISTKEMQYPFVHVYTKGEIMDMKVNLYREEERIDPTIKVNIEQVDLNRLFVRIDQKETPLNALKNKKVAIIGMGSGGSLLALYLAKSGVKKFIFIDDDLLETHNIIRHICNLENLGRFKTKAVKDYIETRIPDVQIQTVERKFVLHSKADFDFFLNLLKNVDLIASVSGEHDINYTINDFIHSNYLAIPVVYAGTFDGVKGGLMFKVDPRRKDFCYHCVYSNPDDFGSIQSKSIPTTTELEQKISYDRTLQEQLAQPGLGLDIDNLTILVSKFCLDVLLTGTEHGVYHFPYNFYMWFNRTIFTADQSSVRFEGLELYYYEDLNKSEICPFHGQHMKLNNLDEEE